MADWVPVQAYPLLTAVAWSVAVLFFKKSGDTLAPAALNLFKVVFALVLLGMTLAVFREPAMPPAPTWHWLLLLASGAVGIGLADTLFFRALNLLGASRVAIVDCLYAPSVVLFSYLYLGEQLSLAKAGGGMLIISGILLLPRERGLGLGGKALLQGIGLGGFSMVLTAAAVVAIKPILANYSVLWATSVRMAGGALLLGVGAVASPAARREALCALKPGAVWKYTLPGSFLGTYVGLLLWIAGFKYNDSSLASILNQTSTVITVVLAVIILRERLTVAKSAATALAFVGTVLVLTGCSGVSRSPATLLKGAPALGWYTIDIADPGPALRALPDTPKRYARRFHDLALGLSTPPCAELAALLHEPPGPVFVLVPGLDGDGEEWHTVVPILEATEPAAVFMFRWSPYERRDTLAETLAAGISRIAQCSGEKAEGPIIVLAHSAGGVLAALGSSRIVVAAPEPVFVITVASPLAGMGERQTKDQREQAGFVFDLGTSILEYPPPAPAVRAIHLRTSYPADPVMKPRAAGHEPNRRGIGVPGAAQVDLPSDVGHIDALLYAAHEIASGDWRHWLERAAVRRAGPTLAAAPIAAEVPASKRPQVCVLREDAVLAGDSYVTPSFGEPPGPGVKLWEGSSLPKKTPEPSRYASCRACSCSENDLLVPWDDWVEINRRAHARLRLARAPYPVAIVPGFAGGGLIETNRLKAGLKLLKLGWVGALVFSGGYRRSGVHEARAMLELAGELARKLRVDITDRIFIEPCATRTITNLRNSLRLMAALGLRSGLLVTDSKMSGQAFVFYNELEERVATDLGCAVGRVSYLLGDGPLPRIDSTSTGCQPPLSWKNNPVGFLFPSRQPSVFWISPFVSTPAGEQSALACRGGSSRVVALEPDNQDPLRARCLPVAQRTDLTCSHGVLKESARAIQSLMWWVGDEEAPEKSDSE